MELGLYGSLVQEVWSRFAGLLPHITAGFVSFVT